MTTEIRTLEDAEAVINSLIVRWGEHDRLLTDHAKRFDTLQTPWWKRLIFWLDGWPWHDLNARQRRWRPWH